LAEVLGVRRRTVRAVFEHVAYDLVVLRQLRLEELEALPGVGGESARKLFYFVQWERLQSHLEANGELPEPETLVPLLGSLTPIYERHFKDKDLSRGGSLSLYREQLAKSQVFSPWGCSYAGFRTRSPLRCFLAWLGF